MDVQESIYDQIRSIMPARVIGSVVSTEGIAVSVAGFPVPLGALAQIEQPGQEPILAEAVGFRVRI